MHGADSPTSVEAKIGAKQWKPAQKKCKLVAPGEPKLRLPMEEQKGGGGRGGTVASPKPTPVGVST